MVTKIKAYYRKWHKNYKKITYHRKLVKLVAIINWPKDEINCTIILTITLFTISSAKKDTNSTCNRMPKMYRVYLDLCSLTIITYYSVTVIEHRDLTQIKLTAYWLPITKWVS